MRSTLKLVISEPLPFDPVAEAHRHWVDHGWAAAADGMAAVTSIMRAQQILLARTDEVLRPQGLTFARYEVLMLLTFSRHKSLPMKTIGSRLQVHPTSVTNAVDRLEAAGFVRRCPHPDDGRAVLVGLTPEGQARATRATEILNREVFLDPGVSPRRVQSLIKLLGDLRSHAGDF